MQQIDTAVRRLAKQKDSRWTERLAYPPSVLEQPRSEQARNELERCLKSGTTETTTAKVLELVAEVQRTEPQLSIAWWIVMYVRLFRSANVAASLVAKRAAAQRVVADAASLLTMQGGSRMLLAAAIYLGDDDEIRDLLRMIEARSKGVTPAMRFDALLSIGQVEEARELARSHRSYDDRVFYNQLKGKRIALVGPARNTLRNGGIIDGADVVVRTTFVDNDQFRTNAEMLGTRTDISFYNSKEMQRRGDEIYSTLRSHPKTIAAFRSSRDAEAAREASPGTMVHRYHVFGHIFYGRGFALRHAITDLVRAGASEITVYGADFFLSPITYFQGYSSRNTNQVRAYINHDVFDSWRFMRMLRSRGHLKSDHVLSSLLDLDEAAFADAVRQRIHEHGGRKNG